jgi:predicted HTH domain antitoxin
VKIKEATAPGWETEQLIKLIENHPDIVNQAVHQFVLENEDIRWSVVVGAYQDEQINLGKAAEFLGLSEMELRERFVELGIPLRVGAADVSEARAEVSAIRSWFSNPDKSEP